MEEGLSEEELSAIVTRWRTFLQTARPTGAYSRLGTVVQEWTKQAELSRASLCKAQHRELLLRRGIASE